MDNKENNKINKELEENFIDYYGMTLDDFSALDLDVQEILIEKVNRLRKKMFIKNYFETKFERILNILENKNTEYKRKNLKR